MKQNSVNLRKLICVVFAFTAIQISAQVAELNIRVDANVRFQQMDGFGVNINPAWWLNGEYTDAGINKTAIDMLIDSLGACIFRVVIEEMDWEAINDNHDPFIFNWDYFNQVFTTPRFRGVWSTLHYLNQRGIKDDLMISFMGGPPAAAPLTGKDPVKSWMGNTNFTIDPAMEDEFAETITAFLFYARNTEKIQFRLVSPMNETDIISGTKGPEHPDGIVEGPNIPDAVQYARIIRKLAQRLDDSGMEDIRFVTPDAAGESLFNTCFDEILKDPYLTAKVAAWGVHQYGKDAANYRTIIENKQNPVKRFWVTETAGIKNLLGQLDDSASAHIFWDGYDCVYQHGRRNGYGNNPPNDWVFWEGEQGKPLIAFDSLSSGWIPRKQFYEFSQVFRFIKKGAVRIAAYSSINDIPVYAYLNPDGRLVILGWNSHKESLSFNGSIHHLPGIDRLNLYFTNSSADMQKVETVSISNNVLNFTLPPGTLFTLTGYPKVQSITNNQYMPEPPGWYAGDMHVHRNCGDITPVWDEDSLREMMKVNNLAVIVLLADIGNGEVKESKTDPGKITGSDADQSTPERIVHWDAEWHFDPAGVTFEHKALGGHLVLLGLNNAQPIWEESPYKILEYGKKQKAVMGFCHMQYLNDSIQDRLNCCIPIDYPVEIALGTIDFLSEDVWLNDAAINAYYRILNCGFRPGWCAGTDFPCNNANPPGSLLTYVQVKEPLTYSGWINGIKNGRTVVTTNGHIEFLDLRINDTLTPGDELKINENGMVNINVVWTSVRDEEGSIEIICNGKVVAETYESAGPSRPVSLMMELPIEESSWICARRMNSKGHQSHTAPVYITVDDKPVRASADDAEFFIAWIQNVLDNIKNGAPWRNYFTEDLAGVRARYRKAAGIYKKIAAEARKRSL